MGGWKYWTQPEIIGAIIGAIATIAAVFLAVYLERRRRKRKRQVEVTVPEPVREPAQSQTNSPNSFQFAGVEARDIIINSPQPVPMSAPVAEKSAVYPDHSYRMGEVYDEHLEWRKSRDYFKRSAAEHEQATGPVSFDRADALIKAGNKHCELAEYQEAIECWLEAEAILREKPEENQANIAAVYNNIAVVYKDQGEYGKALEWYFKAFAIDEKVLGKEHPSTAGTYNNIAAVYDSQGEYEKALEWYFNQGPCDIRESAGQGAPEHSGDLQQHRGCV